MHAVPDDEDQSGFINGSVPVGQESCTGACMRDLRRHSGRGELENSHGDVFLGVSLEGDADPRLVVPKRGSMFGSGSFRLNRIGLSGLFHRIDNQAGATGRLHHRRAPGRDCRVLCLRERRKRLGEELVAERDDLLLAH